MGTSITFVVAQVHLCQTWEDIRTRLLKEGNGEVNLERQTREGGIGSSVYKQSTKVAKAGLKRGEVRNARSNAIHSSVIETAATHNQKANTEH